MHSSTLILAVLIVAVSVLDPASGSEEKNCKEILHDMTKRQLTGISKCSKSMKFKNAKDKSAKMNCILKCVLSAEGILSPEGTMPIETFEKFLEKEVPASMKERTREILGVCQQKHSDTLDPEEESCKSYDPFIKCLMGSIMQLCPS